MRKRKTKIRNWAAVTILVLFVCAAVTITFLYRNDLPVWFARQAYHYAPTADELPTASPDASPLSSAEGKQQTGDSAVSASTTTAPTSQNTSVAARTPAPTPTDLSPNTGEALDFSILPDGRLDINLANRKQLIDLPGIGEVLSLRIIEYRDQNGPFLQYEDLLKVQGIKRDVYENLKNYVGVSFEQ